MAYIVLTAHHGGLLNSLLMGTSKENSWISYPLSWVIKPNYLKCLVWILKFTLYMYRRTPITRVQSVCPSHTSVHASVHFDNLGLALPNTISWQVLHKNKEYSKFKNFDQNHQNLLLETSRPSACPSLRSSVRLSVCFFFSLPKKACSLSLTLTPLFQGQLCTKKE